MSDMSRREFIGAAGIFALGTVIGLPRFSSAATTRESRVMMGTFVDITVSGSSAAHSEDALEAAFAEGKRLEAVFSRFDGATPVSELNRVGRLTDAPAELVQVLGHSARCHAVTHGAFDVTVQPVVDYLRARSNPCGSMVLDETELAAVRQLVDADALKVSGSSVRFDKSGMGLTLDGIAKGYIADCMGHVLRRAGVRGYLVNAGGDISAYGGKDAGVPWKVAVESPVRRGNYPAFLELYEGAVATSGGYENRYDVALKHSHLVDPASGESPFAVASVSVKAPTAVQADALATALSVMAAPAAVRLVRSLPGCGCFIVMRNGQVFRTGDWLTC